MKMPETAVLKKYGIYGLAAAAVYLLLTKSGRNVTRSVFVSVYGPPETAGYVRLAGGIVPETIERQRESLAKAAMAELNARRSR